MKSYTDIEQSRKLAEILPLESADMQWLIDDLGDPFPFHVDRVNENEEPCWSLAALLDIMPKVESVGYEQYPILEHDDEGYEISSPIHNTDYYDNPIDACYEMILKLHELNLL